MAKKAEMEIEQFVLANESKVRRAIEGTVTREGKLTGGVGSEDPIALRAEYDRLGGLILKDGRKVRTGAFWDFQKKEARKEPRVIFEHRSASGELFEYTGEVEPVEVVAEKATRARKAKADKAAKEDDE